MIIFDATELGNAIRARRKELSITQQRIADITGVNRRVISELESGKETVQFRIVIDTVHALGMDISIESRQ